MVEIKVNSLKDNGQIQISNEAIATIVGTAAMEVEGVYGTSGNISDFTELLGKKNFAKGVKLEVVNGKIEIDINLNVKSNYKVQEVCENVQAKVKNALETMLNLEVLGVNINVNGVVQEKDQN